MPDATARNARDTMANSLAPSANSADKRYLDLKSGERYVYVFFNRLAPLGATVLSAKLRLYHRGAWGAGSRTVTAKRVSQAWKVSRLTWDNRPGVVGGSASATDAGGGDGTLVELDVTAQLQLVSDGAAWYGWRVETDEATVRQVYSASGEDPYRPTLYVSWTEAPQQPTTLSPSGNRAVSLAKPVLRFDFTDELGDTALAAVQAQVNPTNAWTSPSFDSGAVASTDPELDLAATAYAGLAAGSSAFWRVRVQDGSGLWSPWSDAAQFNRNLKGALTITNPAASPNNFVNEHTPPITWTFTGAVQKAWQVLITNPLDPADVIADSGKQTGTANAWTVPTHTLTSPIAVLYRLVIRVWDAVDREGTPGDPVYQLATRDFDVRDDAGTSAVTGLTATAVSNRPRMQLDWARATAPDYWVVTRDGNPVEDQLLPADSLVSGTAHRYLDDGMTPWRQHTWQVKAVVNHKQSGSANVTGTPVQTGIWISDKGRGLTVWMAGKDAGTWAMGEDATVVAPLGSSRVTRRVQSQRGMEGSLSGVLVDRFGTTAVQYEADLLRMRDQPTRPVTIALGDVSLRVILGNIATYPGPDQPPTRTVTFDFWEVP